MPFITSSFPLPCIYQNTFLSTHEKICQGLVMLTDISKPWPSNSWLNLLYRVFNFFFPRNFQYFATSPLPNASIIGCTKWSATVSDYAFVISTSVAKDQPQLQDVSYAVTGQPKIFDNSQIYKKKTWLGVSAKGMSAVVMDIWWPRLQVIIGHGYLWLVPGVFIHLWPFWVFLSYCNFHPS